MLLINVKMPTIVGMLTFIGRINFMLSRTEHEKKESSSPDLYYIRLNARKSVFKISDQEIHKFACSVTD